MVSRELINYIKRNLDQFGKSKIKNALLKEGYPEELADSAIRIAVKVNEQEKEAKREEEKEKIRIKELKEKRESKKEQLKTRAEESKKKVGKLRKKTAEKTRKNSKVLIPILIIIILGASFFVSSLNINPISDFPDTTQLHPLCDLVLLFSPVNME